MRLSELIKRLEQFNPDLPVSLSIDTGGCEHFHIANVVVEYESSPYHPHFVRIYAGPEWKGIG